MGGFQFYNTGFEAIFSGLAGTFIAQFIKVVIYICTHKKINFKIFTTTGGMPSSHTAGVIGLSTSVALIEGIDSILKQLYKAFKQLIIQDAPVQIRSTAKKPEKHKI